MADAKVSLDYWRKFFSCAKSDIFELIEKAILVARVDRPEEFKDSRGLIAEKLYTSPVPLCLDCYRAELQALNNGDDNPMEEEKSSPNFDDPEESQIVGEVMRIKEVLCNYQDESDSVLYESLRSLQLMQVSVETLITTEIGRTVNALRKHNSKQIRNLVRTLIDGWKVLVDQWVESVNVLNKPPITDFGPSWCSSILTSEQEPSSSDEVSVTSKLEIAQWKLLEGFQREESEKQQRIQAMGKEDLPVNSHEKRRPKQKLGNHSGN